MSDFDADKELQLAHNLAEKGVDGIMLIGMDSDDRLISFLEKVHIPHVNSWHFRRDSKYHWVGFDNRAAIQAITSYVFQHGHRDVVFFVLFPFLYTWIRDPDPHRDRKLDPDPDPHQNHLDPKHWYNGYIGYAIRTKIPRIYRNKPARIKKLEL